MADQANNRTNNILIDVDGEKLTLSQWCARYNIKYIRVYSKITKTRNPNIEEILAKELEKVQNKSE